MATLCKNCGRPVKFDPASQRLTCDFCGSKFRPDEVEEYAKDLLEDVVPQKTESDDYMDTYVYSCSSCGGEVFVNGSEASTTCIYCGSSSVVFSRIAKNKKPDFIIPFRVSKEEAIKQVRNEFKKGITIPREVKKFRSEDVRGIYIPYWIVNAEHHGSVSLQGTKRSGKYSFPTYYARTGYMEIKDLPVESSTMLSDESSMRLEPFNLGLLKPFDENYLLGFYSNIADIDFGDLQDAVETRGKDIFEEYAKHSTNSDTLPNVTRAYHDTLIDYTSLRYAMFPAWFITYFYKGQFNTILVNGETGKVVCGVPWNKPLIYTLYGVLGTLLSVGSFLMYKLIFQDMFFGPRADDIGDNLKVVLMIVMLIVAMFSVGVNKMRRTLKSLSLTQQTSTFRFVRRRQG